MQRAACTKEPSRNNERWKGEKKKKTNEKRKKHSRPDQDSGVTRVSCGPPPSPQPTPSCLPPEKLKALFGERRTLLRLLLFTLSRIAFGGECKAQEKASASRKSCRQASKSRGGTAGCTCSQGHSALGSSLCDTSPCCRAQQAACSCFLCR